MPSRVVKLQGHAEHLLDGFLGLREKYAVLDPMLFDTDLVKKWGSRERARGFEILRATLYLTCVQEIAKLSLDSDERAPSVHNFVGALGDESLRSELREHYAVWRINPTGERDPDVIRLREQMELRKQGERRTQFDANYDELGRIWSSFSVSLKLQSFVKIRDKLSAHTDVHYRDGKYVLLEVKSLGLKWGDIKECVETLQHLVELINLLVRNSSFAWDMLDEQLEEAVVGFWGGSK